MGSSSVLDIDAILRPIRAEEPAGQDLRRDTTATSTYYRLKEARAAARAAERQAETDEREQREAQVPAEWREVQELAARALSESSKDLELAAWLIEALCRFEGFAGLRDGFRIARGLVEGFWEELWPRPDEDGLAGRLAPISGLNGEDATGTLIAPIARIPITDGESRLASWHYQKAFEISRVADAQQREALASAAGVTLESFQRCVERTPTEFYRELVGDIEQSLEEFEGLCRALDERGAGEAPPSSNIRAALRATLETVQRLTRDRLSAAPSEGGAGDGAELTPVPRAGLPAGPLRSREDAFSSLQRVAEYFRNAEPHSPLSYVLEQAVRWGRLPLPALLGELIPDDAARGQFMKLTGIRAPEK